MTSDPGLRAGLVLAGAGGIAVLLPFLGIVVAALGLLAILAGAVLTAPAWRSPEAEIGGQWWTMLAAGALLLVVAVPLRVALEAPGGLLVAVGGALVVVAVCLGFPGRRAPGI